MKDVIFGSPCATAVSRDNGRVYRFARHVGDPIRVDAALGSAS
jgi:hypothetical protein